MFQLTVGYVAGIIAAGTFVARIWAPNTITFIVSAILGKKASASTWNAAARAFQRSHWPDLLRTDSVIKRGVRLDILLLTRLMTLIGFLIAIAGVITPLGLYQDLQPSKNIETPFQYLKDTSPFGYGTPPRSNYSFSRACGQMAPKPCPFTDTYSIMTAYPNGTINWNYPRGINIDIPKVITETYSSGTDDSTTISNYFDIQYRRYMTTQDELYNNASIFLVGAFRNMQSLVLNNAREPVEGLIVDTVNGGIGLRNHTVPPGFQHGVTWKEDILFIEPETVCVDTNLTIDFDVAISGRLGNIFENIVLTDRGGFVNLNHTYPPYDLTNPQKNSDLAGRAYTAAWLNNALTALFYNVTNTKNETTGAHSFAYMNSEMNKEFPLPDDDSSFSSSIKGLDVLGISTAYGDYLSAAWSGFSNKSATGIFSNPFHITDDNFTDISIICSGAGSADYANMTNILVGCGMMRGVPRRKSSGSNLVLDSGSSWSQPLFTCASSVKATVKTVSFNYNGTDGLLKSLAVVDIKDKNYTSEADMPLWGVEDNGNSYYSDELSLIWGLVSPDYEKKPNVTTVRQPSLYLPGWMDPRFGGPSGPAAKGYMNLPGSDFHISALGVAYKVGGYSDNSAVDYSGSASMAMWTRWQDLTNNTKTAALIPNLIFTDVAAASIVGTKGVLGPGNTAQKNMVTLPVTPTVLKIRYHYLYAIPALLAVLLLALVTCLAFLVTCFRGFGFHRMRIHLQQVSPGRIYTTFLYPGPSGMTMKAKEWVRVLGRKQIDLAGDFPLAGESISLLRAPEKGVTVTSYECSGLDAEEGEVLMAGRHTKETSQGDIGYGFAQPQQYHSQYVGVPQQSANPPY